MALPFLLEGAYDFCMSEDSTKDLEQKYDTKPTLETVVQMLGEFRASMESRFDAVDTRLDKIEERVDRMEGQLDRATSVVHETRAELRELKGHFKEPA